MCVLQLVRGLFGAWNEEGRAAAWAAVLALCAGHALWHVCSRLLISQQWPCSCGLMMGLMLHRLNRAVFACTMAAVSVGLLSVWC
jgi:hypothetical protein